METTQVLNEKCRLWQEYGKDLISFDVQRGYSVNKYFEMLDRGQQLPKHLRADRNVNYKGFVSQQEESLLNQLRSGQKIRRGFF